MPKIETFLLNTAKELFLQYLFNVCWVLNLWRMIFKETPKLNLLNFYFWNLISYRKTKFALHHINLEEYASLVSLSKHKKNYLNRLHWIQTCFQNATSVKLTGSPKDDVANGSDKFSLDISKDKRKSN